MNTDGEMLPMPAIEIQPAPLRRPVLATNEDEQIWQRVLKGNKHAWKVIQNYGTGRNADDRVMLTRTMCPEAKPAVKDLAVFLKFSQ